MDEAASAFQVFELYCSEWKTRGRLVRFARFVYPTGSSDCGMTVVGNSNLDICFHVNQSCYQSVIAEDCRMLLLVLGA